MLSPFLQGAVRPRLVIILPHSQARHSEHSPLKVQQEIYFLSSEFITGLPDCIISRESAQKIVLPSSNTSRHHQEATPRIHVAAGRKT